MRNSQIIKNNENFIDKITQVNYSIFKVTRVNKSKSNKNKTRNSKKDKKGSEKSGGGRLEVLLRTNHIFKAFMNNTVLNDISIELRSGECLALVGENGAGKSTLMKILTGIYKMDQGEIEIKGKRVEIHSPIEAQKAGIAIIHQELNLIPNLSIAQNIFLGKESIKGGHVDDKAMKMQTADLLERMGIELDPGRSIDTLSVAEQQIVEIVKVLSQNADIIIMDEPTAALSAEETGRLFDIMDELRKAGKGIIYISHRLEEIYRVAQRICVLRDGKVIAECLPKDTPTSAVVEYMVGQTIQNYYPRQAHEKGAVKFQVSGLSDGKNFFDVSFAVREGEVYGIAGLVGAGQTPLARCLYGLENVKEGTFWKDGKEMKITSPGTSIREGIGLVTENRKEEGLILPMKIKENIGLSPWSPVCKMRGIISKNKEEQMARESIDAYSIKAESIFQEVVLLSGGNQQKVVLAKVLSTSPQVVIFCEPTRGVDVNGKVDIYNIMNQLLEQKKAVILISSEIPEIIGMSDRIGIMYKGRIVKEMTNENVKQEDIMFYAAGGYTHG